MLAHHLLSDEGQCLQTLCFIIPEQKLIFYSSQSGSESVRSFTRISSTNGAGKKWFKPRMRKNPDITGRAERRSSDFLGIIDTKSRNRLIGRITFIFPHTDGCRLGLLSSWSTTKSLQGPDLANVCILSYRLIAFICVHASPPCFVRNLPLCSCTILRVLKIVLGATHCGAAVDALFGSVASMNARRARAR